MERPGDCFVADLDEVGDVIRRTSHVERGVGDASSSVDGKHNRAKKTNV